MDPKYESIAQNIHIIAKINPLWTNAITASGNIILNTGNLEVGGEIFPPDFNDFIDERLIAKCKVV